jgi:hypothetical protein
MVDAETTHIAGNRTETVDQNESVTIGLARSKVSAGWQAAAHPALSDMASVEP